eukprot:GILK01009790.1.p1 GENE.GILK01009790.1~~GILK01009790.1.p1  ORF type:complete len:485 (-),score=49.86 GILK01009790.1:105-1496(-)
MSTNTRAHKRARLEQGSKHKDDVQVEINRGQRRILVTSICRDPLSLDGWGFEKAHGGTWYDLPPTRLNSGETLALLVGEPEHPNLGPLEHTLTNDDLLANHNKLMLLDEEGAIVAELSIDAKLAKHDVAITQLDLQNECVFITNSTKEAISLGGWKLESSFGSHFVFDKEVVLKSHRHIRVWSGKGAMDRIATGQDLIWSKDVQWNNRADCAVLFDAEGLRVSTFTATAEEANPDRLVFIKSLHLRDVRVVLVNPSSAPTSMSGWYLTSSTSDERFTFPPNYVLAAGAFVQVCGGSAASDKEDTTTIWTSSLSMAADSDTITLCQPDGRIVSQISQENKQRGLSVVEVNAHNQLIGIRNNDSQRMEVGGWAVKCLSPEAKRRSYHFPDNFVVEPYSVARLWCGPGADKKSNGKTDLAWTAQLAWHNQHDCVALFDDRHQLVSKTEVLLLGSRGRNENSTLLTP